MNQLTEGQVIVPYMRGRPILLMDNTAERATDTFIRTQKHEPTEQWYADVDPKAVDGVSRPTDPNSTRSIGAIVFLTVQQIRVGEGVRITRVFKGGKSARGVIIPLPPEIVYPYDHDTRTLFKPVVKTENQAT